MDWSLIRMERQGRVLHSLTLIFSHLETGNSYWLSLSWLKFWTDYSPQGHFPEGFYRELLTALSAKGSAFAEGGEGGEVSREYLPGGIRSPGSSSSLGLLCLKGVPVWQDGLLTSFPSTAFTDRISRLVPFCPVFRQRHLDWKDGVTFLRGRLV